MTIESRNELLRVCSWCGRCHDGGAWVEAHRIVQARQRLDRLEAPAITHGICPACADRLQQVPVEPDRRSTGTTPPAPTPPGRR